MIRRHPDIKILRRPQDVDRVVALQARLLRALWPLLAPGGRMLYATCTVLDRENDGQIASFCAERPAPTERCTEATRRYRPGEAGGDGFYYAWLVKPHSSRAPSVSSPQP